MIPVTKPFLPPIEEYDVFVKQIWKRQWLTNNGPLVNELELKLKEHLNLPHLLFVTNGTIAIQLAIKALGLKGEIITTPFSYVATTSSIVWEGCKPVFVDIDKNTLNIDPLAIESAITPSTSAILATHCFGNPCDIDAIQIIAEKHGLKVIYDAAHCFGTKYKGKSVFEYGDVSTTSFHATKLYHTIEGGAVFTKDSSVLERIAYMRNFGHSGPVSFNCVGINGKNSEFHAAMGLANLKSVGNIIKKRKELSRIYDACLPKEFMRPSLQKNTDYNYSYYPVIIESEEKLLVLIEILNRNEIFPRRYFYPTLNKLPYIGKVEMPVSEDISKRIICLPLYFDLTEEEVHLICRTVNRA
ncbi:DegT/DnrJ/EryC1/StrS family aminotransferase [Pontibacter sp. BT731]|uniref:DegT/DnrJ/EryC1/StrS family aminotransferase n=1 Tax=Pontibacter coccineus TaxID=3063328 RepID=UPI0026E436D3|nr:DegT/DnrJ/EryC1/StrS family aminotransferase [Pontibacter sp. BT731]MDO6390227.1 DegT/DnrJ/EryC1/StrS family aminotransferase [Pontibacter sp. BT731]